MAIFHIYIYRFRNNNPSAPFGSRLIFRFRRIRFNTFFEQYEDFFVSPTISIFGEKLDTNTKVDREKIDQQKDAIALRSAIATEKLEKDSINKVMDKAEKITSNMDKITSNIIKPNGGL